jgi:putative component of membrane protein insertase Oxa1/YidC/SpoIIIJ protein YidD
LILLDDLEMNLLKSVFRQFLIQLISWYQKRLSPLKGYSCAHRLLYGCESCSQFIKQTLQQQDLKTAIQLSSKRFAECNSAARTIMLRDMKQQFVDEKIDVKPRWSESLSRRKFLLTVIVAAFTFGFITPATASEIEAVLLVQAPKGTGCVRSLFTDALDGKISLKPKYVFWGGIFSCGGLSLLCQRMNERS